MKRIRTFVCIEIDGGLRKKMSQVSAKLASAAMSLIHLRTETEKVDTVCFHQGLG